jgi:hypothetical protein
MRRFAFLPIAVMVAFASGCADTPVTPVTPGDALLSQGGGSPKFSNVPALACVEEDPSLECSGRVTGVGNLQLTVTGSAAGTADVLCTNPGGQRVEAQDHEFTGTGSAALVKDDNGNFHFNVVISPTGGCPNGNWKVKYENVVWTSPAILELRRGNTIYDTAVVPF